MNTKIINRLGGLNAKHNSRREYCLRDHKRKMGDGIRIQSAAANSFPDRGIDSGPDYAPYPVHLPLEQKAKGKETGGTGHTIIDYHIELSSRQLLQIGWYLMGRPLEGKAEAEPVVWGAVALHWMDNLSIQEQKLGACHDIRIQIAMIPRHLYSSASIKPEKQYFSRQHIRCSSLKQQIRLRTHIIHIPGKKQVSRQSMFVTHADGTDEKGKRDKIVWSLIRPRPPVFGKSIRRTKGKNQQYHQTNREIFFHLFLLSKSLSTF